VSTKFKIGDLVIVKSPVLGRMRHGIVDGFYRWNPELLRIVVTSRSGKKYRVYYHERFVRRAPIGEG